MILSKINMNMEWRANKTIGFEETCIIKKNIKKADVNIIYNNYYCIISIVIQPHPARNK